MEEILDARIDEDIDKTEQEAAAVLASIPGAEEESENALPPVDIVIENETSAISRRATRRGYFKEEAGRLKIETSPDLSAIEEPVTVPTDHPVLDVMSEEEYSELDEALSNAGEVSAQRNWNYATNEDRLSLVLGVIAGFCICAIVLFLLF